MASLTVPSFPNRIDDNNPLVNAYAWIAGLSCRFDANTSIVVVNVHPSESAWQSEPAGQVVIHSGDSFPAGTFRSVSQMIADDPVFASAFATIATKLYAEVMKHPLLASAVPGA